MNSKGDKDNAKGALAALPKSRTRKPRIKKRALGPMSTRREGSNGDAVVAELSTTLENLRVAKRTDSEAVASLIIDPPPAWLVQVFDAWVPTLAVAKAVYTRQPTRAQVRSWLKASIDACNLLTAMSQNTTLRDFLDEAGQGSAIDRSRFEPPLNEFRLRAEAALASPALTTPDGNARSGRGPARPVSASSELVTCAMMVAEAWKFVHGEYPKPRNKIAAEAAERFLSIVEKSYHVWGAERANAWRSRFKEASDPNLDKFRATFERFLREAKHSAALLVGETDGGQGN